MLAPPQPGGVSDRGGRCAGRPTVLHHHDLPWQRPHLAHLPAAARRPGLGPRHHQRAEPARAGGAAASSRVTTLYNTFDPDPAPGDRLGVRRALGLGESDRLLLQPTRALERKNIPAAVALAEAVRGVYWLLGPAEDGYGPELGRVVAAARCPVVLGAAAGWLHDRRRVRACDAVLLPSSWEGFGNPSVESATHRRPLAIGPYPVARELAAFGFRWFDALDPSALGQWLAAPDDELLEHNHAVAARSFNVVDLPDRLCGVLDTLPGL